MPLPTFLFLILTVILAAGLSIALLHMTGGSMVWLGLLALFAALGVRGLKWL
jgi:heme A synthase